MRWTWAAGLGLVGWGIAGALFAGVRGADAAQTPHPSRTLRVFEALCAHAVAPQDAVAKALAAHPGTAVEIELDTALRDGRAVAAWEIEVLADGVLHEVRIDAHDGSVLAGDDDDGDEPGDRDDGPDDETAEAAAAAKGVAAASVTLAQALERVRAQGGAVTKVELETEDGATTWDVEYVAGGLRRELELDAKTGRVVPDDDEDADDEGDDDDDEHDDE